MTQAHLLGEAPIDSSIQGLTDNGSPYIARHTHAFALDIGLEPLKTPVCSLAFEYYNEHHPHSALKYRSQGEFWQRRDSLNQG